MSYLGIIGVSIHQIQDTSSNVKLLGQLTIARDERVERLKSLKDFCQLEELVYIATCNRVEFIFWAPDDREIGKIRNRILDFFSDEIKDVAFSPNDFYLHSGLEGIRHLYNVSSAIDSLVVGEAQILGQVKDAFAFAADSGLAGANLDDIFQQTFRVAKKVRTETDLGKRPVSMVSLVTALIDNVVQNEGQVPIALVGVGEMTHKLAGYLNKKDIDNLIFVNRTYEKARQLTDLYGGQALSLDDFMTVPPAVRVVCTATSAAEPVFNDDSAAALMAANRHILFIDLAIPCDVVFENRLENRIQIRNIADLKEIAQVNRRQRFRAVDQARAIIADEVVRYHRGQVEKELRPAFSFSYQQAKGFADKGLDKLFNQKLPHLDETDKAIISHWVDKLVSYTSFLPAKTLADKISKDADDKTRSGQASDDSADGRYRTAFRKGA